MLKGHTTLILLNRQHVQLQMFKATTIEWCFETPFRYRNLDNTALYISTHVVRQVKKIII